MRDCDEFEFIFIPSAAEFPLVKEPASMEHSAAVMLILFPYLGRTHVLMIKRAMTLKLHKGEIAFLAGFLRMTTSICSIRPCEKLRRRSIWRFR